MTGLEVLDISYNALTDLYGINFAPMKELKILNAANNNLAKLEHIDHLKDLREVDLSGNRIRQFEPNSFSINHQIACDCQGLTSKIVLHIYINYKMK